MKLRHAAMSAAVLLLAACGAGNILPEQPGAVIAMERYYARHGIEGEGRCLLPEMTVTKAEVVEQRGERVIVDADYHWDDRRRSEGVAQTCMGFGSRRFTLYQGRVMAMSGEQR